MGSGTLTGAGWVVDEIEGSLARLATDPLTGNATGIYGQVAGVPNQVIPFGSSGGLPAYLGQVATRCFYNTRKDAGNTQAMLRTFHYARDDITSLQLVFGDRYTSNESASGSATTIECAVEYPAGTYTRVKFSGSDQGSMSSGGDLTSDAVAVTIPSGAKFWLRTYRLNASGLISAEYVGLNTSQGEGAAVGASVANAVMGGTITSNGFYVSTPIAIIGLTTKPSVLLIGDSRVVGVQDTQTLSGDLGEFARSVGGNFGYISVGINGTTASSLWTSGAYRTGLAAYCSHVFCNLGINDVSGGASLATIQTRYNAIWTNLGTSGTKPVYQATLPPESTSTDSWATVVNQTAFAQEAVRVTVNAWVRSQGSQLAGILEIADAVESGRDSGKWKAAYTSDGVHENITGTFAIVSSGCINPALIVRR